jgi:hypothetical protein
MSARKKDFKDVDVSNEILNQILDILEQRREQMTTKSTVGLAASSGLIVLEIQFIMDICKMRDYTNFIVVMFLLVCSLIITALSIIASLDLIKRISRKKHIGSDSTAKNIFYFGWLAKKGEEGIILEMKRLDKKEMIVLKARQSFSLAKNLKYRYKKMKKTYIFFIIGLIIYLISIIIFLFIKYNVMGVLLNK